MEELMLISGLQGGLAYFGSEEKYFTFFDADESSDLPYLEYTLNSNREYKFFMKFENIDNENVRINYIPPDDELINASMYNYSPNRNTVLKSNFRLDNSYIGKLVEDFKSYCVE